MADSKKILTKLTEIIADKIDVDPGEVSPSKSFDALGADSLDLYEMVYEVENVFGVSIPENKTGDLETVQDVIDFIDQAG